MSASMWDVLEDAAEVRAARARTRHADAEARFIAALASVEPAQAEAAQAALDAWTGGGEPDLLELGYDLEERVVDVVLAGDEVRAAEAEVERLRSRPRNRAERRAAARRRRRR